MVIDRHERAVIVWKAIACEAFGSIVDIARLYMRAAPHAPARCGPGAVRGAAF
jgi:hypothetical protein